MANPYMVTPGNQFGQGLQALAGSAKRIEPGSNGTMKTAATASKTSPNGTASRMSIDSRPTDRHSPAGNSAAEFRRSRPSMTPDSNQGQLERAVDGPVQWLVGRRALQKCSELVDREAGFADEGSQSALREGSMVGNNQAPMRSVAMPENDMASALSILLVTDSLEGANRFATRDDRELAQTATSTSSSWIEGGMGSSRSLRLSR